MTKAHTHSPGTRHVGTQLLQQALPVAHVQVGAPSPNLALDALEDDLQLAVRLPLEDGLHVGADRGVDALSPLACEGESVCAHDPGLGPPTCPLLPAPHGVQGPGGFPWQTDCWNSDAALLVPVALGNWPALSGPRVSLLWPNETMGVSAGLCLAWRAFTAGGLLVSQVPREVLTPC